jgi:hypothetical protein
VGVGAGGVAYGNRRYEQGVRDGNKRFEEGTEAFKKVLNIGIDAGNIRGVKKSVEYYNRCNREASNNRTRTARKNNRTRTTR